MFSLAVKLVSGVAKDFSEHMQIYDAKLWNYANTRNFFNEPMQKKLNGATATPLASELKNRKIKSKFQHI